VAGDGTTTATVLGVDLPEGLRMWPPVPIHGVGAGIAKATDKVSRPSRTWRTPSTRRTRKRFSNRHDCRNNDPTIATSCGCFVKVGKDV